MFEGSRAGFHAWRARGPGARERADAGLGEQIDALFTRGRRTCGSPRLHRALRRAGLHHSDRGCQYASEACREHPAAWKLTPSMSRRGNCGDHAAMESFRGTLKEELVHRRAFASRAEAASAIFDDIETFY